MLVITNTGRLELEYLIEFNTYSKVKCYKQYIILLLSFLVVTLHYSVHQRNLRLPDHQLKYPK